EGQAVARENGAAGAAGSPHETAPSIVPALTLGAARALADSLLLQVSATRGLKPLLDVPVKVADRDAIRQRLDEITAEGSVETRLRHDERIMKHLGLIPADRDLLELYKELLEEQIAGFYDIDRRELVLADWVPAGLQAIVATHELTHALQDQHFSLRVRKKLGFEDPDAEAAWYALLEGDASSVMAELALQPLGRSFTVVADSMAVGVDDTVSLTAGTGVATERFLEAPDALRGAMSFPYVHGLRFVAEVYAAGGWQRVDDAYIHPPVSTEQILHPERYLGVQDRPVRVELPDLRGLLRGSYVPVATTPMGEYDLYLYLKQYVDPEIARISAAGWSGCATALYGDSPGDPDVFVLSSVWDSEDDALEFFGALIGVLEVRYPEQEGWAESSSVDQILWKVDEAGRYINLLRLRGREVVCVERAPGAAVTRVLQKLDRETRMDDPSPDVRAMRKDQLPWNRPVVAMHDSALTLRVELPEGWTAVETPKPHAMLEAHRASARLEVVVDRDAQDRLGVGGYTHALAQRIQERGTNVYIHTDVNIQRDEDVQLYQHVFTQLENGRQIVYYLGVADLRRGFGYVLISEPRESTAVSAEADFYSILETLAIVPAEDASAPATQRAGASNANEG
ncbi:MAG: hypothetical protein ACE5G2_11650, partial [Candidatus Krumholzibacteriia bacterium]